MAEETNNEETRESESPKPAKKGLPMPLIMVAVILALAALGAGGFFLYSQMQPAEAAEEGEADGEESNEITETNIYFNGFQTGIVNLEVSGDYPFMYLKYNFDVEVENHAVISELAVKMPRLTSRIAGTMSNRNWNDISTTQGRDRLARDCLRVINEELTEGQCIGLYFTTFIAQ